MSVAPFPKPPAERPQSLAERIAALQAELRTLNADQVSGLCRLLADAVTLAAEVAANPTQAAGIRDVTRRLAEDLDSRVQTIEAIVARGGQ